MKCKVLFFEFTPVYSIFNDEDECIGDGIGKMVKIYPGKPINIEKTIEDIEKLVLDGFKDTNKG